ncbi:GNAT family N-acetyltransferase [Aureimonas ureilytica]|uniref:hypothetical protein n=1 Tax=Aureimonas ureilytica TaxID=401562 RepID=UPI000A869D94|nr:hypothetical protein [Aureimonas ureilytica]
MIRQPSAFDSQPTLAGDGLLFRPVKLDDLQGLYGAASDPETWAGHPAKNRHKREVFEPYFPFPPGQWHDPADHGPKGQPNYWLLALLRSAGSAGRHLNRVYSSQ